MTAEAKRSSPTTDAAFHRFQRRYAARLTNLVDDLIAGQIDAEAFYYAFGEDLQQAHALAASYGRRRAGGSDTGITEADRIFGRGRADYETEFLDRFVRSLEEGIEDGSLLDNPAKAYQRAGQYSGALRGTGNAAFVDASPEGAEFYWRLGASEDHCSECPYLASQSPYLADELPIYPGSNGTPCLFNCTCSLERSDGRRGFPADTGD